MHTLAFQLKLLRFEGTEKVRIVLLCRHGEGHGPQAAVLVQGAGGRSLCADGDIVAIYRDILAGGGETVPFWEAEYRLNSFIARYPKPYIALMDGLVPGVGVGISAHGSVRIVTERTRTDLPETTIGFVPDVGGTLLLARAPGRPAPTPH